MEQICKNCKRCIELANSKETGAAICTYSQSFSPTNLNDICHYLKTESLKCKDCSRFGHDYACATVEENDPVDDCIGFLDPDEELINNVLFKWAVQHKDYHSIINDILESFDKEFEFPFIER